MRNETAPAHAPEGPGTPSSAASIAGRGTDVAPASKSADAPERGAPGSDPANTSAPEPSADAEGVGAAPALDSLGNPLPNRWLARVVVIWCGQAASVISTCAASFAAIWFITETTSSAVWLSLASAASLLPVALLSPFGGVVADRANRKRVMVAADGLAGIFSLAIALAAAAGALGAPLILALLSVRAAAQAFHSPAMAAVMPRLVPADQLVRINTLDQALVSLAGIVGPPLGILLYSAMGLSGVMLLDAACAGLACACLAAVRIPAHEVSAATRDQGALASLRDGAAFLLRDRGLRGLMLLVMVTMLLFMPASSLSPLLTYQHFGGDGYLASAVEAVFGVGVLAGSALMFAWGGGKRPMRVVMASGAAIGVALGACGLLQPSQFPLFVVLVGVLAAAIGCLNAPLLPILQRRTPEGMMGRAMGIFQTGTSLAAPAGLMFSGFAAEGIGITRWFAVCGLAIVLCFALASRSKAIRSLDE